MNKNTRICIIGAGPAGLSCAMFLEGNGYTNYEIYEKTPRVGGKCFSPLMVVTTSDGTTEERSCDLGATFGDDSYLAIHRCEQFAHVDHMHGEEISYQLLNPDGTPYTEPSWVDLKESLEIAKLKYLLQTKYKGYETYGHRRVAKGAYEGHIVTEDLKLVHVEGTNPHLKDLALPFNEFLELNHCEAAGKELMVPFTARGYGYFDEVPAAYVVKYLNAMVLHCLKKPANVWIWKDGTQALWESVNRHLLHSAHVRNEVTSVKRQDGHVFLTLNNNKVEVFGKLIITTPLDQFLTYGNPNEEERRLFSKIHYKKCLTMAVGVPENAMPESSYYYPGHMNDQSTGHLMGFVRRWPDCAIQPLVAYALRNHTGKTVVTPDKTESLIRQDMERSGFPVAQTYRVRDWVCFPYIKAEDYRAGWYDQVEELQGRLNNTYYAGEIMGCGNMEETVEYSSDLVRRFFFV